MRESLANAFSLLRERDMFCNEEEVVGFVGARLRYSNFYNMWKGKWWKHFGRLAAGII